MNSRNLHIDIAKGLGILLVVFGHNWLVANTKGELFNVIYSFHIPLFLFLSGLFFNPTQSWSYTVITKSDALLKPYFTTFVLLGFYSAVFNNINFGKYFLQVLYATGSTLSDLWIPLWFLPHLFAVTLLSRVVICFFKINNLNKIISYMLVFGLFVVGIHFVKLFWFSEFYISGQKYKFPGLPFSIDIAPITIFYFLSGYTLKKYTLKFQPSNYIILMSFILFVSSHYFFNSTIDLNLRSFDTTIIPTIESLSGIYLILSFAYMLHTYRIVFFAYIGESAIFILIFHGICQSKAFDLATNFLGEKGLIAAVFSFVMGCVVPVILFRIVKRVDLFALVYLPVKSSKFIDRLRGHYENP